MLPLDDISCLKIGILAPEKILKMSHGEVTVGQTLSTVTLKPVPDGLLCQRIFGPVHSFRCACGKLYRRGRDRKKVCKACGVEVSDSSVRRAAITQKSRKFAKNFRTFWVKQ